MTERFAASEDRTRVARALDRLLDRFPGPRVADRAAFLRTVARELDLPLTVLAQRAEDVDSRETADVVTSRALAALPELLRLCALFAGEHTRFLLPKGRNYRQELDAAAAVYHFTSSTRAYL